MPTRFSLLVIFVATASGLLLPGIGDKSVTIASSAHDVQQWLDVHCVGPCVLGFDTESRPSFRKGQNNPPAVVQLSTIDACLVAQIYVADNHFVGGKGNRVRVDLPPSAQEAATDVRNSLGQLLESRSILKVGVGIDDDAVDLWQYWGFEVNGRVELGYGAPDNRPRGLARLLSDATGIAMQKSSSVQTSDWAAPLSERQVQYAAADAWAGVAVYERLQELDEPKFGYEAVRHRLLAEKGCANLYAMRTARQACKAALAAASDGLEDRGLPLHRGDAEQTRVLAKRAQRRLSEARSLVTKSLASDRSTYLPVGSVLEDAPPPPLGEAEQQNNM